MSTTTTITTTTEEEATDDDVLYDSAAYDYSPDVVSLASVAIWSYLVLHLYVEFAEYMIALQKSKKWGTQERFPIVRRQAKRVFYTTVAWAVAIFVGFSIVVSYLTQDMDNRAAAIIIGLSRLTAGVIFAWLSINVPQMTGLYYSRKKKVSTYKSVREVIFNLSWSLWMQIITMFFMNLFFSSHTAQFAVLYGIIVGAVVGICLIRIVHYIRKKNKFDRKPCSIVWIMILLISSWVSIIFSMTYIADVWFPDREEVGGIVFLVTVATLWALFTIALHLVAIKMTNHQLARNKSFRYNSQIFQQNAIPSKLMETTTRTLESTARTLNRIKTTAAKEEKINSKVPENNAIQESPVETNEEQSQHVSFHPAELTGSIHAVPLNDAVEECDDDDEEVESLGRRVVLEGASAPSLCELLLAKVYETYPWCCCCLLKYSQRHLPEPRLSTVKVEEETCPWKTWVVLKRVLWYALSCLFLYMTIVNIGATQQQTAARDALGPAWDFLYPDNYQTGPMCAWNETTPNADIRTFTSLQAVFDANYKVAHCGACGDCSNWNDLSIQWTTRTFLKDISKKCAAKSLFGGPEKVQKCNEETIGFLPGCANCWTYDEINTKDHCFWIYLQSFFIDAFADFRVGYTDITSAACDEALSGPVFVPCSGATRRRMGIISGIQRPQWQQCPAAKADWALVFNHP